MKRIIYSLILSMAFLTACDDKVLDINEAPYLEVTTEKTTYKVGEEVVFNIDGNPRLLNFWSGEEGSEYERRRTPRIISMGRGTLFSFEMRYQYPNRGGGDVRVMVSTDFEGDRSSFDDVDAATWTDITDQCNIDKVSEAWTESGVVDVSYLMVEDKPMYFAFKYVFDPTLGFSSGPTIWIRNVQVEVLSPMGNLALTQDLATDFLLFPAPSVHKHPTRSDNRTSYLVMLSNAGTSPHPDDPDIIYTNTNPTQEYFVTRPFDVYEPLDLGPDRPVTLKHYTEAAVPQHVHVFNEPGVYQVKFIGSDHSIRGVRETIREFEITVLPADD